MAQLTAAFAASHSVMLTAQLKDWQRGFRVKDQTNKMLFDRKGEATTYDALLKAAPAGSEALVTEDVIAGRFHEAQAAMDRLEAAVAAAPIDVLLICGDDQLELFGKHNMPAIAIVYSRTIRNAKRPEVAADDWYKRAQMQRLEPDGDVHYPVDAELAEWLIRQLSLRSFDVTAVAALPSDQHEGHAFSFIHRRLMPRKRIPIVPIMLNTYIPPNQPTPRRCVQLGRTLRELIAAYPKNLRIGVLASGGLSHFVCDEALDHAVIEGIRNLDTDFLSAIEPKLLQAGSSEIRNWLVIAEAARELKLDWVAYIPGYRTPALTGTGLGFAEWRPHA